MTGLLNFPGNFSLIWVLLKILLLWNRCFFVAVKRAIKKFRGKLENRLTILVNYPKILYWKLLLEVLQMHESDQEVVRFSNQNSTNLSACMVFFWASSIFHNQTLCQFLKQSCKKKLQFSRKIQKPIKNIQNPKFQVDLFSASLSSHQICLKLYQAVLAKIYQKTQNIFL